jgi:beta-lysine N6-acetyltransferase
MKGGGGMAVLAATKIIIGDGYRVDVYFDPFNKRVRIDDYQGNIDRVIREAEEAAENSGAEKLIVKVRQEDFTDFLVHGFTCEAKLDRYFLGSDMYFFSKYFQAERLLDDRWIAEDQIIKGVYLLEKQGKETRTLKDFVIRKAGLEDSSALSKLYREVFPVYPTPLHEPEYVAKTIDEGTIYYVIEQNKEIVSAASAEVNYFYKNAELTDCATLNSQRKHGLVKNLLRKLEIELKMNGIYCVYSLARAQSFGMNAAFYQLGYDYRGRLKNNCFIYDKLENMNLWVKDLSSKGSL